MNTFIHANLAIYLILLKDINCQSYLKENIARCNTFTILGVVIITAIYLVHRAIDDALLTFRDVDTFLCLHIQTLWTHAARHVLATLGVNVLVTCFARALTQ